MIMAIAWLLLKHLIHATIPCQQVLETCEIHQFENSDELTEVFSVKEPPFQYNCEHQSLENDDVSILFIIDNKLVPAAA